MQARSHWDVVQKITVSPQDLWVPHQSQTMQIKSIWKIKIPENFKKQSGICYMLAFFTYHLHCICSYLHDIYIVLGILSILEMI